MKWLVLIPVLLFSQAAAAFHMCGPCGSGTNPCLCLWSCPMCGSTEGACTKVEPAIICGGDLGGGNFVCDSSSVPAHNFVSSECRPLGQPCQQDEGSCSVGKWEIADDAGFSMNADGTLNDAPWPTCTKDKKTDEACFSSQVCEGDNCAGGCGLKGDPLAVQNGQSVHNVVDVRLPTPYGEVTVERRYRSDPRTSILGYTYGAANVYVPRPYGTPDGGDASSVWMNSFQATVRINADGTLWTASDTSGALHEFSSCAPAPCFATRTSRFANSTAKLYRGATGFVLLRQGERRLVYEAPHVTGSDTRYFLSRIEAPEAAIDGGALVVATVNYADPGGCPGASSSGVPYISSVTLPNGSEILWRYGTNVGYSKYFMSECVVVGLDVRAPGGNPEKVVDYAYWEGGRLFSARYGPDGGQGHEEYGYSKTFCTNCSVEEGFVVNRNGVEALAHRRAFYGDYAQGGALQTSKYQSLNQSCQSADCISGEKQQWNDYEYTAGFQTAPTAGRNPYNEQLFFDRPKQSPTPIISQSIKNCGQECSGQRGMAWSVVWLDGGGYVTTAVTDWRQNMSHYVYAHNATAEEGQRWEVAQVFRGAGLDGGPALERTDYTYSFGSIGPLPQRRVETESQDSVLSAGATSSTVYAYEQATDRLKAVFRTGYTRLYQSGTWQTVARTVGTFYFTRQVCSGGAEDSFGRVVEVHGPCEVANTSATDCAAATEPFEIRQFDYFATTTGPNAGQLQRERRFVGATDASSCSGPSLTKEYGQYTVWGRPGLVTDEAGVTTTLTYEGDMLASSETGGAKTEFRYEKGVLVAIKHPEGNYDVFCHRVSELGSGCPNNVLWSPQVQWTAKAADALGNTWSEGIRYKYFDDGTLMSAAYYDSASGTPRREEKYAYGKGKKLLGVGYGNTVNMTQLDMRNFDPNGNLIARSIPGLLPNMACGGVAATGVPQATTCSVLKYDRADRLAEFAEPGGIDGFGRTCFSYDAQGNVSSVRQGCPTGGTTTCASCTEPASTYQHDDFGNRVSVQHASFAAAGASFSYEFNAAGQERKRQTPTMATAGELMESTYDGLGRQLTLVHSWVSPTPGSETLYSFTWDSTSVDNSCPQPSNTTGRMASKTDTFGTTAYQYDVWGHVVGEIRLRAGTSTCSTSLPNESPHTFYGYTANGLLQSITYPYGRIVTYGYRQLGGVTTDRISTVSVKKWDGTVWNSWTALSGIVWEPYGDVRGYQIESTQPLAVEYLKGTASDVSTCPQARPTLPGDGNGLTTGLWVTRGSFVPGSGAGDVLQKTWWYTNQSQSRERSCLLGTTQMNLPEASGLNAQGRPANVTMAGSETGRASHPAETFTYDRRLNRTALTINNTVNDIIAYSDAGYSDRLVLTQAGNVSTLPKGPKVTYAYDDDGRVTSKQWEADTSGLPGATIEFTAAGQGASSNGGLESVYRAASVNGAVYGYYYDAFNRRRLKQYPVSTVRDEFFYDTGHNMLVDVGNDSVTSVSYHPTDEYVWLGNKPVMVFRGKLSTSYVRSPDDSSDCARNGEAASCGARFIITDVLGKPVLLTDDTGKVAASMEYDVFGHANRYQLRQVETAHPYIPPSNATATQLVYLNKTTQPGTKLDWRFKYERVDTEGTAAAPVDFMQVHLYPGPGLLPLGSPVGGYHRGNVWGDWVNVSVDGGTQQIALTWSQNNKNYCLDGGSADSGTCYYSGASVSAYEFRRYEVGSKRIDIPIRFPGQYYDSETELHENWNRYYEPHTGRYLQPEPILNRPRYVMRDARRGHSVPAFAYAVNSPLHYSDATGLDIWIEGPSGGEPNGHRSINVGNPFGEYVSFSFGWDPNSWGAPYFDKDKGGPILDYLLTTPEQDVRAMLAITGKFSEQRKLWYGPNTCRTYSQDWFDHFKRQYPGSQWEAPDRDIATWSPSWLTPFVGITSSPTWGDAWRRAFEM